MILTILTSDLFFRREKTAEMMRVSATNRNAISTEKLKVLKDTFQEDHAKIILEFLEIPSIDQEIVTKIRESIKLQKNLASDQNCEANLAYWQV